MIEEFQGTAAERQRSPWWSFISAHLISPVLLHICRTRESARGLRVLKRAISSAATKEPALAWSNPHHAPTHKKTLSQMPEPVQNSNQTDTGSSSYLQNWLYRPQMDQMTNSASELLLQLLSSGRGGGINSSCLQRSFLLLLSSPCFKISRKIPSYARFVAFFLSEYLCGSSTKRRRFHWSWMCPP